MTSLPTEQLTAERAFLIAAVRAAISGERVSISEESLDWAVVADEAWHHGVMPQLWQFLNVSGLQSVPAEIRESLAEQFQNNTKRNLRLTGELWRLMELFKSRGISALPFKGPTLAILAYGDLAWREFTDLDILVAERDMPQVADLLVSAGYQPRMNLSVLRDPVFLAVEREIQFVHSRSGTLVELQWQLSSSILPFNLTVEYLRENQMFVRPGGKEIPTLGLEDLLFYVCAHGTRHCWERLGWIADVAGLINRHPELDWELAVTRARAQRCEQVLLHSLLLARDLFGARLPQGVELMARSDADTRELAASIGRALAQPLDKPISKINLHQYFLKLQPRAVDRVRHLWRMLFTATVLDWRFWTLPQGLMFLYPFIRPLRLIAERLPFSSSPKSSS